MKRKKTAQDDELDRTLAHCTFQRFVGCSAPSLFLFVKEQIKGHIINFYLQHSNATISSTPMRNLIP
jgi:hypothetical protein